ncbi:MAG TPA: phenylalanine--tRNA ligase subunit beta [Bacteroidota bacterium]|jgi:phenylalanyl-tRNA synthetase beta chain
MKLSLNWLKEYVGISAPVSELAERLTMLGLEVEDVHDLGERYKGFIIGAVLDVRKHPGADKLVLCRVNTGAEILEIVCGAPNVGSGQRVVVALPGAVVPHDQHDPQGKPFKVTRAKIRGEVSNGMICSEYELDLGGDRDGILILGDGAKPGQALADYLGLDDIVLEIGVTPNRPDALSHIGIAREIALLYTGKLTIPSARIKEAKKKASGAARVRIEDRINCPRYTARVVEGVTIADSPEWIKKRLTAVGIRPVNNVVDITNYVLMEIGQPLHAFDYDKIAGKEIIVRQSAKGESFTTLDGKARLLQGSELMICDRSGAIALAGVMGGANSEISASTRNVFIESAYFNPRSIRRTSKALGLSTDASQRFERGMDPNGTVWAADRAASLIQSECGGEILKGRIDVYPRKVTPRRIPLRVEKVNDLLGITLTAKEISQLLKRLWIFPAQKKTSKLASAQLTFEAPTWRPDLEREIDLIEEVARVYGYDRIDAKSGAEVRYAETTHSDDFEGYLRQLLSGSGFNEMVTNSMQERSVAGLTSEHVVEIANPISKDMAALRTSLIPSLLSVVGNNISHGSRDIRLFEIGKAYFREDTPPNQGSTPEFREETRLVLGLSGSALPRSWDRKPRQFDMSDLKGEVEALFNKIFLDKFKFIPYSTTKALTEVGLSIEINGRDAGMMGRIRADVLKKFEVEQDLFVAELSIDALESSRSGVRSYRPLPRYPSVVRDLALTVDQAVETGRIEEEIRSAGGQLLTKVELFDIFSGEQIEAGKKSCAFALEFMSEDHTLVQEEVDKIMEKIIQRVASRLQATLRS